GEKTSAGTPARPAAIADALRHAPSAVGVLPALELAGAGGEGEQVRRFGAHGGKLHDASATGEPSGAMGDPVPSGWWTWHYIRYVGSHRPDGRGRVSGPPTPSPVGYGRGEFVCRRFGKIVDCLRCPSPPAPLPLPWARGAILVSGLTGFR